jgi:signal transduction histidine kinase
MMINAHRQPVIKSLPPFDISRKITLKESNLGEIVGRVENLLPKRAYGCLRTKIENMHKNLCIMADGALLEEALMNLAQNAIEAMSEGGLLTIRTDLVRFENEPVYIFNNYISPACAIISVTDSGTGMDKETMERMFEPFFTTKGETGKGLGLSIVHSIVKQHGGCIKVESTLGKGTTIKIYLPLARAATDQTEAIPSSTSFFSNDAKRSLGYTGFAKAG